MKEERLELQIHLGNQALLGDKELVKGWLMGQGVETFIESACDDQEKIPQDLSPEELCQWLDEQEDSSSPLIVESNDGNYLESLRQKGLQKFPQFQFKIGLRDHNQWLESWRQEIESVPCGSFLLVPPWLKSQVPEEDKDLTRLYIDPTMVFGTGHHETTQLCLQSLESWFSEAKMARGDLRLFDIGTGTGVIALAAAKLGVPCVEGMDIDPDSIANAKNNQQLNDSEFPLLLGDINHFDKIMKDRGGRKYHLICANIFLSLLKNNMGDLVRYLEDNGELLLSGILEEQAAEVIEEGKAWGLSLKSKVSRGGWSCVRLEKLTA